MKTLVHYVLGLLLVTLIIYFLPGCGGDRSTDSNGATIEPLTVTDIDGNVYQTVKIGDQLWMAENLRVTHYRNGQLILCIPDSALWAWTTLPLAAYCNYNNDESNVSVYGRLYNWYAVTDTSKIAPEGWHVPSDAEWQTLVDYLGGPEIAGGKMKEPGIDYWITPNTGATNESGFSALPGGYRDPNGHFDYIGIFGHFLSSSASGYTYAWKWRLNYYDSAIERLSCNKRSGFSVRCVKD
ncbi:MAG TPA: hypothetical protein ENO22_14290 [candidate division Zixibacteria bacterium]|nr:hypothetical protein [candidate division Zixibacteria bacterium]HER00504.1 hypothetical protein [candidate division Zixibacteria bacterium]